MGKLVWGGAALLAVASAACGDDGAANAGGGGPGPGGAGGGITVGPTCTGTESDDPQFSLALGVLRETLETEGIPGGAIAVVQDGKLVNLGVMGTKQAGVCDPITPDTLFGLPYMPIILTSIAALDAVEEGKLSLTDPITNLLSLSVETGAEYADDITLHHLLTHSSMYTSASDSQPQEGTCTGLAEAFANSIDPAIEAPPGTMMDWEDRQNIELAALLLETVDQQPFADVIATRVLGPLGMGGTFDLAKAQAGDHSLGYQTYGEDGALYDCPNHYASYGYRGSIRDYVKLAEFLTGDGSPILEPATFAALGAEQGPSFWTNDYSTYMTGAWRNAPIGEGMQFRGGGTTAGFNQILFLYPDRKLAVIVMINADIFVTEKAGIELSKIYGVDPAVDLYFAQEVQDPASLETLAGTYVDAIGFKGSGPRTLQVTWDPNEPTEILGSASVPGIAPQAVSFEQLWYPDNFKTATGQYVRFWRDDAGVPFGVQLWHYNGPPFFRVMP